MSEFAFPKTWWGGAGVTSHVASSKATVDFDKLKYYHQTPELRYKRNNGIYICQMMEKVSLSM